MTHRLLTKYPRTIVSGTKEVKQYFNYLLVLDFESTCKRYEQLEPQEIIEFPCAALSTTSWQIENLFHEYVKPKVNPVLTSFCTELTGIIQDMVETQPHFPEVFKKFQDWLEENKYFKDGNDSAFVTCGDWDLKVMLPKQCELDDIPVPPQFKRWINLKGAFCDTADYYPRNLMDMLSHLNLGLEGKLHSGIDDVKNMVRVIQALQSRHDAQFKINNAHNDIIRRYKKNMK